MIIEIKRKHMDKDGGSKITSDLPPKRKGVAHLGISLLQTKGNETTAYPRVWYLAPTNKVLLRPIRKVIKMSKNKREVKK